MAIDFLLRALRLFTRHAFFLLAFAQRSYLHIAISDEHVSLVSARVLNLHNVLYHLYVLLTLVRYWLNL